MDDNSGQYFMIGEEIREASEMPDVDMASGKTAYEVLRIIDGVPLFYLDHYERMKSTIEAVGRTLDIGAARLQENIKKLLSANGLINCNVKIIAYEEHGKQRYIAYNSKSYYPSEAEADIGVRTGLLQIERQNPNAKLLNKAYKDAVSSKIKECGYFEVILVDSSGRITEGSKSNAFFVKGRTVCTAPGEAVLKGITRKYVIEACRNAGFEVIEQFVEAKDIAGVDGAFLSGTSIKVLPVKLIDGVELNSPGNPVVAAVRREYNEILEKYIENNVKTW